jgi:hypothetical protein
MVTKAGIICTHSVKVRLRVLGEVKVDDDIHSLDVDTPGEQICKQNTKALPMYGTTVQSCPQARSKEALQNPDCLVLPCGRYNRPTMPSIQVPTATKDITASYACQAEIKKESSKTRSNSLPEDTKFRHAPFRKSWNTRLRWDCSILAWM